MKRKVNYLVLKRRFPKKCVTEKIKFLWVEGFARNARVIFSPYLYNVS